MKKGETRAAYLERKAEEERNRARHHLEARARFLEVQLANVRREIAERAANQLNEHQP